MTEKQEWKQNVAKEFIAKNISLAWLWEVKDSFKSLKNFVLGEKVDSKKDTLLWDWLISNVMNILFNKHWWLRTKTGFELNKIKSLSYYLISSEWKEKLDLLFNEMEKANSETELKASLSDELQKLESEIENEGNDPKQDEIWINDVDEESKWNEKNNIGNAELNENEMSKGSVDEVVVEEKKAEDVKAETDSENLSIDVSIDPKIENAVQWAKNIAADDSHWYQWWWKWIHSKNFDCSWLVCWAFKQAWFNIPENTWTAYMKKYFVPQWFVWHKWKPKEKDLRIWDILLAKWHTELYIWNWKKVWAHSNYDKKWWDSSWKEISINSFKDNNNWIWYLRYEWSKV